MSQHSAEIGRLPLTDTPSGWGPLGQMHVIGEGPSVDRVTWFDAEIFDAGCTGHATARRLGEFHTGQHIASIDALPIGWGAFGRKFGLEMPGLFWLRAPIVVPAIEIAHWRFGKLNRFHIIETDQTDGIECCAIRTFTLSKNSYPACGAEAVMNRTTCKLVVRKFVRSRL